MSVHFSELLGVLAYSAYRPNYFEYNLLIR